MAQVEIINYLSERLSLRESIHATLVQVHSSGVLLIGRSGIGKSEIAVELIRRGHRLVADDRVEVRALKKKLYGSSPKNIARHVEIRGLGIFEVTKIFGINAYTESSEIDYAIKLNEQDTINRVGVESEPLEILNVKIPTLEIPVLPGRDMGEIVEIAVTLLKLKGNGYDAFKEFEKQLNSNED
jgi:HPr kinase/phosphorylase